MQPPRGNGRLKSWRCIGADKTWVMGDPDPDHVSTSYVERSNLTMRMAMRRFTRLTNAFSKKVANHAYAVDIHLMHCNFCRPHMTSPRLTRSTTPRHPRWRQGSRTTFGAWKKSAPCWTPVVSSPKPEGSPPP
jgi:hypothetical protein